MIWVIGLFFKMYYLENCKIHITNFKKLTLANLNYANCSQVKLKDV